MRVFVHRFQQSLFAATLALMFVFTSSSARAEGPGESAAPFFSSDDAGGGESVHLPSLLVTRSGTAIAVCQLRKTAAGDWGHDTDILLRRSTDGGKTWGAVQVVYHQPGVNAVNGPIVQDRETGRLILPITEVPAKQTTQAQWVENLARTGGSMNYISSDDDGKSWSPIMPAKATGTPGWVAWPSNSSHGIQLASGRLILGAFIAEVKPPGAAYQECEYSAGVVYSDDRGATWHIGAHTPYHGTDEIAVAPTSDGDVYVNFRHNNRNPYDLVRGYAKSRDKGESFYEIGLQDHLSRCDCHVGLTPYSAPNQPGDSTFIYSGPTGLEQGIAIGRHHLAIRISYDNGHTWPVSQVVVKGSASYSDLAIAPDGAILCLYGISTFDKGSKMNLLRLSLKDVENVYTFGSK